MVESAVKVTGLAQLRRELKRLELGTGDLKAANEAAGRVVLTDATARAPRGRTGRLAGSGRAGRGEAKAVVTFGGATVPYARPIHWGWPARKIEPHPFAVEAARATEAEWLEVYKQALDDLVEQVARGVAQ